MHNVCRELCARLHMALLATIMFSAERCNASQTEWQVMQHTHNQQHVANRHKLNSESSLLGDSESLHNERECEHKEAHGSKATAVWGLKEALCMVYNWASAVLLCSEVYPAVKLTCYGIHDR